MFKVHLNLDSLVLNIYLTLNLAMRFFYSLHDHVKLIFFNPLNPLTTNVPHYIETSQLICNENQLTGFYMMGNIGR